MRAAAVVSALGPIDWKSVRRDPLLRWMFVLPLLIAALLRFGLPPFASWLAGRAGVAIEPYTPLLGSMVVMVTPMMYGTVIGFLLLDQKDDRTLTALQVTPLTTAGYFAYRMVVPVLLSVGMTVVALRFSGLSTMGPGRELVAALGAAPLAPAFALFLAAFAGNKVQGFALMKAAGALNWPPMIAWFIRSDWQWAFGLCPTFWPAKLYWDLEAGAATAWPALLIGTAFLGGSTALFLRRFRRLMGS